MDRRLRRSGSAMIELALSLPMLIGLALGTLQFGYSFYVYSKLEQAVRDAARYGSLRTYGSPTSTPSAAYVTAVQNSALYGNPAGGDQPVAPQLTTDNISVSVSFNKGVPVHVTVTIVNYPLPQLIGTLQLNNRPSARFPYLGIFAPAS